MKKSLFKTILLLVICLIYACGGNQNQHYNTILKSDEGNIRGVEIGAGIEAVKALEDSTFLKNEMPDYLYYEYDINMGNSYTATYDFSEENKLYEIEIAVYFDVIEDANTLFTDFSNHYNKKYGKGKIEEDGYTTWHTANSFNGGRVEIAMINDSETYGFLSVIIRDLDY
jgi:hypothetical protein